MTCDEFWREMPELAHGGELPVHARECPSCATLLQRQGAVVAGLSRMAMESKAREAPPRVERRLVKAFRAQLGVRPKPARYYRAAWATAAAVVVVSVFWTASRPTRPTGPALPVQAMADLADPESDFAFIPLPFGFADSATVITDENADLVRVEVPRTALVALGLPVALGDSASVEAEVVLGADGMLEGIRIVQ